MSNNILYKSFLNPFLITIFLILIKWIFSYYFFLEPMDIKIINEVSDSHYFPLIKSFSDINFNPSYSNDIQNLKLISFPILSLTINALFYKFFGSYSFLILEILCVFLFLITFIKIFSLIGFSKTSSILFSLILFILPQLIIDLTYLKFGLIEKISLNFQTFYSLRMPRPLLSNLFFFAFLFFLLKFYLSKDNQLKNIYIATLIMGFTMHAFFYFFIFQVFLITIIYLVKFKTTIFEFLNKNFKKHLYFIIIIILFYFLFFIQGLYDENDYSLRMGLFEIDFNQKKILLNYFLSFFLKTEFISIFLLNTIIYIYNKKNPIKFFYYLFISTILSTLFFIMFFNKGIDYYHFANWILTAGLLFPVIYLFFLVDKNLINKVNFKAFNVLIISIIILYYNFSLNRQYLSENTDMHNRNQLTEIANFLNSKDDLISKDLKILTFNYEVALWLILNDFKNFSLVPVSFWTSKKTSLIEDELISAFKFLNLKKDDFINFLSNERSDWRYKNSNVERFFDRIYLANQLKTFNNEMNYTDEEINFIKKNNPLITHQLIIPKNEFLRLGNKFTNNKKVIDPDIVILNYENKVISRSNLNTNNYCIGFKNNKYLIYFKKRDYQG